MILRSKWLVLVLPLLTAPLWPYHLLQEATGATAQTVCSKHFISGFSPDDVMRDHLRPEPGMALIAWALATEVDEKRREVSARVFGTFESRSVFSAGRGCTLTHGGLPRPQPIAVSRAPQPMRAWPADIVEPSSRALRDVLDRAFREPSAGPRRATQAVVAVHEGRIIAERYAPGLGPDTPLLSHSIAKSVVNALIGILVREGRLRVADPAPIAAWAGDQRASISIDDLLRMRAGFGFDESGGASEATHIWFTEPDMAKAAASAALRSTPGREWGYCSRCYILLSRIIGDVVGRDPQRVNDFAERELFGPLGMRSVTLEFDAAGTLMGANAMFATPRDFARFGMLYLNDGRIGERGILPRGWVDYSTTVTAGTGYGAGFWLNNSRADIRGWPIKWGMPGAPADSFMARGYLGQFIIIVPSRNLVVVRMGQSHDPVTETEGVGALVRDIIAALD